MLAHLYANTDSASLAMLRRALLRQQYGAEAAVAGTAAAAVATGAIVAARSDAAADAMAAPFEALWDQISASAPAVSSPDCQMSNTSTLSATNFYTSRLLIMKQSQPAAVSAVGACETAALAALAQRCESRCAWLQRPSRRVRRWGGTPS